MIYNEKNRLIDLTRIFETKYFDTIIIVIVLMSHSVRTSCAVVIGIPKMNIWQG